MPSRQGYHSFSSFSFTLHFVIYPLIKKFPFCLLNMMENEDPFLEDMVQSLTKVEGIKPKVAKFLGI